MYLKFIGENGSMGLQRDSIYKVKITSDKNYIYIWCGFGRIPYSSPQSFAANWSKP